MKITKDKIDGILNKVSVGKMSPVEATHELFNSTFPKTLYFCQNWKKENIQMSENVDRNGYVLYLGENDGVIDKLSYELGKKSVIVLKPENTRHTENKNYFCCDFENRDSIANVISEIISEYGVVFKIIVEPWSKKSDTSYSVLKTFMFLVQELMKYKPENPIKLLFVYNTEKIAYYSAMDGFFKTLRLENDLFRCKCIKLDRPTEEQVTEILNEFKDTIFNSYVKYDKNERLIQSLSPANSRQENKNSIKEKDIVVITGGSGKIAEMIAMYLCEIYACKVILLGRRRINSELQETLDQPWAKQNVEYISCGISDVEELSNVMDKIKADYGRIDGIIHCAGANDDDFIIKKEWNSVKRILEPKIVGTNNLYVIAERIGIKYMILFSSIASVFGNIGQMDYAYANAYMDAFASKCAEKQENNISIYSVNWPFWEQGGMQISSDKLQVLKEKTGLMPLPTNIALDILGKIFDMPCGQVVALYGDENKLKMIASNGLVQNTSVVAYKKALLVSEKRPNVDNNKFIDEIMAYIKNLIFDITKIPPEKITCDTSFESLCLESVAIMQMNECLEKDFDCVSKTLFYEYKNCRELAEYIMSACYEKVLSKFDDSYEKLPEAEVKIQSRNLYRNQRRNKRNTRSVAYNKNTDIAIVGIAGKYPDANDLDELWQNLCAEKDCISEVPADRWNWKEFYDPNPENAKFGKSYAKNGGFINGVDEFDPYFFNISPIEAEMMDPQERMFLEIVWGALEDAGATKNNGSGISLGKDIPDTGVFVGVTSNTYSLWGPEEWTRNNSITPNAFPWTIANRVSYLFDFHGPSIAYDTACSSSLIAIHEACESIKRGECRQAVAGGVNLYLHPYKFVSMCKMKMLSISGICSSFGENADGFVAGEGCGAIILKTLDDAIKDNDYIYGVIKGTAVNHGGRTNGYTVPSPSAQRDVIIRALENANISARDISYIEAHGTGTILGDPIEVEGLSKAFEKYTNDNQFCAIGSIKSNIGHGESAAGIAGITKIILQMQHCELVPTINSEVCNPNINFKNTPFYLQHELTEWNRPMIKKPNGSLVEGKRVAGISSFGAGGTNAHIVIEEYKMKIDKAYVEKEDVMIVLSAQTDDLLTAYAKKLYVYLKSRNGQIASNEIKLNDIAYTLANRRRHFDKRVAFIVNDIKTLIDYLDEFINNDSKRSIYSEAINNDMYDVANKWIKGENTDFESLLFSSNGSTLPLPTYPFLKEKFWFEKTNKKNNSFSSLHPLVDKNISTLEEQCYEKCFSNKEGLVSDHKIKGKCIVSAAVYIEMAYACSDYAIRTENVAALENIKFLSPLSVDDNGAKAELVIEAGEAITYQIRSRNSRVHCTGEVVYCEEKNDNHDFLSAEDWNGNYIVKKTSSECYNAFINAGFEYGKCYQTIKEVEIYNNYVIACLKYEDNKALEEMYFYPGFIDGALQAAGVFLAFNAEQHKNGGYVPYSIGRIEIYDKLTKEIYAYVKHINSEGSGIEHFDIYFVDKSGCIKAVIYDYSAHEIEKNVQGALSRADVLKQLSEHKISLEEAMKLMENV